MSFCGALVTVLTAGGLPKTTTLVNVCRYATFTQATGESNLIFSRCLPSTSLMMFSTMTTAMSAPSAPAYSGEQARIQSPSAACSSPRLRLMRWASVEFHLSGA